MKNKTILKTIFALFFVLFWVNTSIGQQIYFVDNQAGKVQKSDNDGNNPGDLVSSVVGLYGIATDVTNNKMYYTNVVTDEIFSAGLDGSSPTAILKSTDGIDGPRGIAIDGVSNKIYWAESITGKIKKADLDGSNIEDVVTGLSSPVDVALDLVNNKLYWSDNGVGAKKISESNFDGTSPIDIITGLDQVGGIEVDAESGKIYWVDFGATDKISRANLDGSSPQVLTTIPSGSPRGIAVDKADDKVFWSDILGASISNANRDGTSVTPILANLHHPIGISSNWTSALPVELTTFSVHLVDDAVMLNWETATEVNNYGFEIQRLQNYKNEKLQDWEKIGFIEGHGNSNSPKSYSYSDKTANLSGKYFYRLKQIDIDGTLEYSKQIEVEIGVPSKFEVQQNYPNPFNPSTTIAFSIHEKENVSVAIYNTLGETVKVLVNGELEAGMYQYDFDASKLTSGTYIYRVSAGNNVSIHKMLLLK